MSASSALTACVLAAGLSFLSPPAASAQAPAAPWDDIPTDNTLHDWSDEVPAHVSFAEGEAWLDREGTIDGAPTGVPLLAGDRVRTRQGRLEILFADGSVLSLDENTDAELLSDDLLRLERGRIRLDLTRNAGAAGYRVDAVGTTTWIRGAGEYRLEADTRDSNGRDVRLLVVRGQAELSANGGRTLVRAGYEAFGSSQTTPSLPYAVTVSRWDGFDRWWDDRRATRSGFANTQYLPSEISYYSGVLDREGDWQYEPTYGYVWYPRVIDDWHPYSAGRWSWVGTYGWTWVGNDRWAWPTHHYGRWGYSGRRYYWIPGRQWAPAWVSWASSPDYVGWVPLGYDNRPLISVHIGYSSGWRGWTHVPARNFSTGIVVASRGRYLPPRGSQFSDGYRGPGRPSTIVTRQTSGLRGPGGNARGSVAVPRGSVGRPQVLDRGATQSRAPNGDFRNQPDGNSRVAPGMTRRSPSVSPAPAPRSTAPSRAASPGRLPSPERSTSPARSGPGTRPSPQPPVMSPRTPQRSAPGAASPGDTGGARPRATIRDESAPNQTRMARPQQAPASGSSRMPTMRSRVPSSAPGSAPEPRVAPGRQQPSMPPTERTERSRATPSAAPSRQRPEAMRAPQQAPRVESPRPSRETPAARQAPASRQAPSESTRGRAQPRGRD